MQTELGPCGHGDGDGDGGVLRNRRAGFESQENGRVYE